MLSTSIHFYKLKSWEEKLSIRNRVCTGTPGEMASSAESLALVFAGAGMEKMPLESPVSCWHQCMKMLEINESFTFMFNLLRPQLLT